MSRVEGFTSDRPDIAALVARRSVANTAFFQCESLRIARLCARMAERFMSGGRLIAIGVSPAALSDVRHVTVEFVHPVIVGKRALPALGVSAGGADLVARIQMLASPSDMVIAFGAADDIGGPALTQGIALARAQGCLTIACDQLGAEAEFLPPSDDPFVRQELGETLYHVLWELVHVFFEHDAAGRHSAMADPGASAFLYPFLASARSDIDAVIADVSKSVVAKAQEVGELRQRTFDASGTDAIIRAAATVRARLEAGGTVLAFGNGGSATDAMDLVADLRTPLGHGSSPRRALDLTEDSAILTALANDVGHDVVFARQIIAYGRPADVAIGFSTSGSSRNVIAAFAEARRRGLATVAFTGYDGGRIAAEGLADYVIVAPSEYVPRIQEAHATAYHILRTLIG